MEQPRRRHCQGSMVRGGGRATNRSGQEAWIQLEPGSTGGWFQESGPVRKPLESGPGSGHKLLRLATGRGI